MSSSNKMLRESVHCWCFEQGRPYITVYALCLEEARELAIDAITKAEKVSYPIYDAEYGAFFDHDDKNKLIEIIKNEIPDIFCQPCVVIG